MTMPHVPVAPHAVPAQQALGFDMQLLPDANVWPVQKITLRPAHGLPMRITPRQLN